MASYDITCPNSAYLNSRVEVTARSDDPSVKKAYFTWSGATTHTEESWDTGGWGSFSSSSYVQGEGRVDIEVKFYDERGNLLSTKSCYFYVR